MQCLEVLNKESLTTFNFKQRRRVARNYEYSAYISGNIFYQPEIPFT